MFGNAFGIEGTHIILQSAVNNEACLANIDIDSAYESYSELKTLKKIIEDRRKLKTNVVGYLV